MIKADTDIDITKYFLFVSEDAHGGTILHATYQNEWLKITDSVWYGPNHTEYRRKHLVSNIVRKINSLTEDI